MFRPPLEDFLAVADHLLQEGNVCYAQGLFTQALEYYNKATLLKPSVSAWNNQGNAYYQECHYEKAIACYEQALHLNPAHANAWNGKGNVLYERGQLLEALACYNQALKLAPDHPYALLSKAHVLLRQQHSSMAQALFTRVLAVDPQSPFALQGLGLLAYRDGHGEMAQRYFQQAGEAGKGGVRPLTTTEQLELCLTKARVLRSFGRPQEAQDCLQRALALKADYRLAQEEQRKLGHHALDAALTAEPTTGQPQTTLLHPVTEPRAAPVAGNATVQPVPLSQHGGSFFPRSSAPQTTPNKTEPEPEATGKVQIPRAGAH